MYFIFSSFERAKVLFVKWFVQKFHFNVCVYDNNWFCKVVFNYKKTPSFSHHVLSGKVGFFVTTIIILHIHILLLMIRLSPMAIPSQSNKHDLFM